MYILLLLYRPETYFERVGVECDYIERCLYFSGCNGYVADIVFVVDSSGSIRDANPSDGSYDNWNLVLTYINNVIASMNVDFNSGVRVGLVDYSAYATNVFYLSRYEDSHI